MMDDDKEDLTVMGAVYRVLMESDTELTAVELCNLVGASGRTYVSRLLKKLIEQGRVASRKEGRRVYYRVLDKVIALDAELELRGLSEEEIWQKALSRENFRAKLSEKAEDILSFTFTEMLNNAIDHSSSGIGKVKIWEEDGVLKFIVRDFGIGIFRGIMVKKGYGDEVEAIQEVLKGKLTTNPAWHSGEGIFWTGKVADRLVFESYDLRLTIDNVIDDYAIERLDKSVIGTRVYFEVEAKTQKTMSALFHQYSFNHEKVNLDTTAVPVKLYDMGETWISRSQAKKILRGLEKFKKVVLDFKGVKLIGQGFADEIFRVHEIHHPELKIEAINMNPTVELMVTRARNDRTGRDSTS